jgi:F0F1-type ATP synthase membrane subunit c/vacuolar-type H+-ATPase subunit K
LTALGPAGTALALLFLGHVIGDFVFQTDEMATTKHRVGPLLTHVGIVTLVHLAAFIPLLTPQTALLVAFVGGCHLLIDAVSARIRQRAPPPTPHLFLGDQLAHFSVILGGWFLLAPSAWTPTPVVTALGGLDRLPWPELTTGAVYVAAFVFAHEGGNTIVRGVLPERAPDSEADELAVGYLIGTLERWIILLLGVAGLWEAIAIVVAVESIARFEELKQRAFAEYFLVGTLTSVLVAIVLVLLVTALV